MKEQFYNDLLFTHKIALSCDYFWPPYEERYEKQFKHLDKGLTDEKMLSIEPYSIIYADSSKLGFFNYLNKIKVPFIIVSAESDYGIPFIDTKNKFLGNFSLIENPNLVRWYSTNVDMIHPKLVCIPIGMPKHVPFLHENYIGWNAISRINDVEYFINNKIYISSVKENFLNNNPKRKLLYVKMTLGNSKKTNHIFENIREESLMKLEKNGFCDIDPKLVYWTEYISQLPNYKFCLSLPGKGLDCYRTWESLSLGVIPIVINTNLNVLYHDLPVLIVNDISEINSEFLNEKHKEICKNIDNYKWEKLSSSYWVNKIKADVESNRMSICI